MKEIKVVCALIIKDNKVFCCKRGNYGECANKWEFPGGKIEPNETQVDAIIRELKEELETFPKELYGKSFISFIPFLFLKQVLSEVNRRIISLKIIIIIIPINYFSK